MPKHFPDEMLGTPAAVAFYRDAVVALIADEIPFLVGGGYAVFSYTGIIRPTKDFDIFMLPDDVERALECFTEIGCRTEIAYSHWLAKAHRDNDFIDIIYSSGNGCCPVDPRWFDHALPGEVLGHKVMLCPPEESIWQKAFIMERERYDGADIVHLLKARAEQLDWDRLLERFGPHWRVLLAHLVLFGFIYPGEQALIPAKVLSELIARLQQDARNPTASNGLCRGPLLSRQQYQTDTSEWGYGDPRLPPHGGLTTAEVRDWTEAKK